MDCGRRFTFVNQFLLLVNSIVIFINGKQPRLFLVPDYHLLPENKEHWLVELFVGKGISIKPLFDIFFCDTAILYLSFCYIDN
jgi:hypothetical protein